MKNLFKKNIIYLTVAVIGILLGISIIFTWYNNTIIQRNRGLQDKVETVGKYYDAVGKTFIHSLDIGLRGFAIIRDPQFSAPMEAARAWKDSLLLNLERPLAELNYNFQEYDVFRDSLNSYEKYCFAMRQLVEEGRMEEFNRIFAADRGAHLWWQYLELEKDIQQFVNRIDQDAQREYEAALFRNQILQIVLFLICLPTLIFTAIRSARTYNLSELLRNAERDKNKMLQEQNLVLEKKVIARTREIAARNQEIGAQSEELASQRDTLLLQNKQLQAAHETIEKQHREIHAMNLDLKKQVDKRTRELQVTNEELIGQNTQLEQYAFIAAHNLRAPLARILGLTNLIKISESESEKNAAFEKLETSTRDLDHVIQDLNTILNIKKHTGNLVEVDLHSALNRVIRSLEKEIDETKSVIRVNLDLATKVLGVPAYVESIFYNLISNAIKYRDPDRQPVVDVVTSIAHEYVCLEVSDNGLGIDLTKHQSSIFTLYKRFHLHMEGKGLGLYLVKTQIEALGGKIEVTSKPNQGASFQVYFRQHLSSAPAVRA
jgi:signal transduction histidine kinase